MSQDVVTFEELYEKYANDVYRFAFWLCGDADDAKDITSETFVRVWTSENETRLESVKGYLFTIARNLHLQQRRMKKRFSPITDENAGTTDQTVHLTEHQSEIEQTMAALDTLSEIDRTVLIMRAQDELPYDEIAAATGLSISTVKVKIFRSRAKLASMRKYF